MEHYPATATIQIVLRLRCPPPHSPLLQCLYTKEADINIYGNLMHACMDKTLCASAKLGGS